MSWFYSVISKQVDLSDKFRSFSHPDMVNQLATINTPNSYCIAGGISETCLIKNSEEENWVICGTGISNTNGKYYQLNKNHWQRRLSKDSLDRDLLDGHFSIIQFNQNNVKVYTDTFGIRKVFYCEDRDNYYLSSRLDWLLQHLDNGQFNFKELSSFWNLQYILNSEKSFIEDIYTSGPEAEITITSEGLNKKNRWWTPSNNKSDVNDVVERLSSLTTLPLSVNRKPLLGLSGGMDCRTLLAILDNKCHESTSLYSFGTKSNPDIEVAADIAEELNITHFKTDKKLLPPNEMFSELKKHALREEMHFPLDYFNIFSSLSKKESEKFTFIDGAAGEFMRNRTGNRLIHRFKLNDSINPVELMKIQLASNRFKFFNSDVNKLLEDGALDALQTAVNNLPSLKEFSPYKWVDLFLIRYAFWGDSCSYLDSLIPNFMPFAQPSLLDAIYNLPLKEKVNNKINLKLIKDLSPKLTKFPLVREDSKAPYFTGYHNLLSTLWTQTSRFTGKQFIDDSPLKIVNHLKNEITSRLSLPEVKNYSNYNHSILDNELKSAIESQNIKSADNILTWLSFDFWREAIEKKGKI